MKLTRVLLTQVILGVSVVYAQSARMDELYQLKDAKTR